MASTPSERRRRAACAVLEPVLSEEALIEALRHQHDHMRGDAVSDIIRFIDQVAERNLLDAAARKRLYDGYFKAMQRPDDDLPMDPWPMMQAAPPLSKQVPPASSAPPVPHISAASTPARPPVAAPSPAATPTSPPPPERPAASVVFGLLWSTVLHAVHTLHQRDFADLCTAVKDELKSARVSPTIQEAMSTGWNAPLQQQWAPDAAEPELADLVHRLYVALCETLGPVVADQVLTHAVRTVESRQEATGFSPRRLL